MNPRIPWEVVVDPLVSVEHPLGATVLKLISRWASQKIARILRNPTFHCVIPKECVTCLYPEPREVSPHPHALLLCIQFYYSPVQTTIFQMVCFITIFLLTLRIVFQYPCCMPPPISPVSFGRPNEMNTLLSPSLCSSLQPVVTSTVLDPNFLTSTPLSKTLNFYSLLKVRISNELVKYFGVVKQR